MHDWFARPIAAGRMAEARQRATVHNLRVAGGRDLTSRLATSLAAATDGGSNRSRRRRSRATAAVGA